MSKRKFTELVEEQVVEMLANGYKTHQEIADTVGLSRSMINKISAGVHRKDLQPRIKAFAEGKAEAARRKAQGLAEEAIEVMAKIMRGKDKAIAAKAAKQITDIAISKSQNVDITSKGESLVKYVQDIRLEDI